MGATIPTLGLANHASSLNNPQEDQKFINKEVQMGGLIGPFPELPFKWTRVNPLMAQLKKDTTYLRIILDLSFPDECSVNSQIPLVLFEGAAYKLRLPTPLDLSKLIITHGRGALLYKVDLARAYRQLRSDPYTTDLIMHIEEQKIVEALELCQETLQSQFLSLHQTKVLLGKMLYVSKLASPARCFLNRLLQF